MTGSSKTSMNTATTTTTQPRRSSRLAAKKSDASTTNPPNVGNGSTQRSQSPQPKGRKKDPRAGLNTTTTQDVEMVPPHHSIQISEPVELVCSNTTTQDVEMQPHQPPGKKPPRPHEKKPSSVYLLDEQRENYMNICVPLHTAALRGDWHAAKGILEKCPEVINMSITRREETVLHVVSSTKHTHFAKKLVNKMKVEDLELKNKFGATALWLAVASTVAMVDVLLKKNIGLLKIRKNNDLPFMCAVWSGHNDIVKYIYSKTNMADEEWKPSDKKRILNSCLSLGLFDVAVKIINHCKEEEVLIEVGIDVMRYLAYKPSAFDETMGTFIRRHVNTILPGLGLGPIYNSKGAEIVEKMWGEIVKQNHEEVLKAIAGDSIKKEGLLFIAARLGNYKFISELLRLYPDIAWDRDDNKYTIFHVAVIHRHENVYKLLYELGAKKLGTLDKDQNNILHLAAIKPAQSRLNIVSGAALQMQRELLWFKEVKTRVNSTESRKLNKESKTPQELFTEQHADLLEKGESWMKHTAAQCMVVAALIATIMFAAAFTLPGGNHDDSGDPIFRKETLFIVFVVADAISLCTSSASILMFLAILTARYTENDFLVSLPRKLMAGLLTLFVSIATMMVAFSASFFLLYTESLIWVPILVATLAAAPVLLFALLQYRLLLDVIKPSFMSRHLFRPAKRMI